ncbi:hypothetical protein H5410_027716 [Solanum commersonii]|uniref:Uncharacterized protein n=1 Tax=Solanum commersonii TaxID=4109 RepID=A0A9J5Z2P1_SOLCO|nr:hypothetical protein H5410_027716 [Solanum commersonii]
MEKSSTNFIKKHKHIVKMNSNNQIIDMVLGVIAHLEHVEFHRWSRVFFLGNIFNIMTSNIAESINALYVDEKRIFHFCSIR